ncbi:putative electon transport protein SCO1/SCO2 [Leptomonas seymouri]|uniref:Putative electon transport protein SCO1/SCO2 n=1 Tax=Leptomonas seymouri TaxID=5684 RepID=A0A0N0P2G6_LEPSE|nr:putative electon transport protein SCO1/SCO2 [Leptomonas seymouri]|eukprot:KPI82929.1 putative electon transport protein SCO1/SCO2 [Leptomonas seymouri]
MRRTAVCQRGSGRRCFLSGAAAAAAMPLVSSSRMFVSHTPLLSSTPELKPAAPPALPHAPSHCLRFSSLSAQRVHVLGSLARAQTTLVLSTRWASNSARSGGKDIDIVDQEKPIHIRVAEQKDSQIYTYNEYVEKHEMEERAGRTISEAVDEMRDNPAWMLWALGFLTLGVMTVVVSIRVRREQMRFDPKLRAVKSFDSPEGPSIGGPFHLLDVRTGKYVTDQDLKGKWLYIYFGFTNCPDVCPEEMEKMVRVINHLDKKVGRDYWQPIFVSLDPRRDTPEKIREYLSDFSPRIMGLVGTQEEVEEAARQYRVYFAIPDEEAMSEDDYLVDHSIIMYLMDPNGKFCDYTTKEFQWFESYSKLLRRMMDFERNKATTEQQRALRGEQMVEDGETPANLRIANVASMVDSAEATAVQEAALASQAKRPPSHGS